MPSTATPGTPQGIADISPAVHDLLTITGVPPFVPESTRAFFRLLYDPEDLLLVRFVSVGGRVETWHIKVSDLTIDHDPLSPQYFRWGALQSLASSRKANVIYGVCPRVRASFFQQHQGRRVLVSWDKAWHVRTIRTLWADIDRCTPAEALRRCEAAGLPRPSAVIASGSGVHLYWVLADPVLIDDVPDPGPWVSEYAGRDVVAEYGLDTVARVRYSDKPEVSPMGRHVEQIVSGILAAVGGDAGTLDLARCLRVPGTLNYKGEVEGKPPVLCEVVEIDEKRRYDFSDFERFRKKIEAEAARHSAKAPGRVELPLLGSTPQHPTRPWPDELEALAQAVDDADDRSRAEYKLFCRAVELGVDQLAVWEHVRDRGKVFDRGWEYFERSWRSAVSHVGRQAHSHRVPPADANTPPVEARVSLAHARLELNAYIEAQLARDPIPGRLNLISVPPGLGKTFGICTLMGKYNRKAVVLTLEKKLAATHASLINDHGGRAKRLPVLRESPCPHPDEYEAMSRRGFTPSQSSPCNRCQIGTRRCPYLIEFGSLSAADQLCGPAVYHTHADFYTSHGNDERPFVVLDESFVDLLLEPVAHPLDDWLAWGDLVRRWVRLFGDGAKAAAEPLLALLDWLERSAGEFMNARDAQGELRKFQLHELPPDLHARLEKANALDRWLHQQATRAGQKPLVNLHDAALYLLATPGGHVFLERIVGEEDEEDTVVVRFRKHNPLPMDREVFLLDATANPELIRAILPGWDVHVWECPPVEQRGRVVQIMDRDVSRGYVRREVKRHRPHNSAWLVQVVDAVLDRDGPMPIISFKKVTSSPLPEMDLLSHLKYQDRVAARYNYPCRGHTFPDRSMIVVGTPYPGEVAYWELAHAIWGKARLPVSRYTRRYDEDGSGWVTGTMGYEESHLRLLRDHFVSAELAQAVGRLRPLDNECTVYVITNAPLPIWRVERAFSYELFDMTKPLRRDAGDRYDEYAQAFVRAEASGERATNADLCEAVGISERTGRRYMSRLKAERAKVAEQEPTGSDRYADAMRSILRAGGWASNSEVSKLLGIPERTGRNYMARFKAENGDGLEAARGKVRLQAVEAVA